MTSEISKLRNPTGHLFQLKKQQSFCIYTSAIISKIFGKIKKWSLVKIKKQKLRNGTSEI